ncbi:MAG: hypothetical protein H0V20_05195 [Actinobacteria bacterium]|nr:hypothetical protein [Actinomycetota bacterium]
MRGCPDCGSPVDESFRYCPWCAAPQRLKLVDFFRPHPLIEQDQTKALRVSRYLAGPAPERHVRFSVWDDAGAHARARAAVSLDEDEARRLARFLVDSAPPYRDEPAHPPLTDRK